jgi:hypothetical protein
MTVAQLVQTPPPFMEPEGLLPCPQKPATVSIRSQLNPVYTLTPYLFKILSNIIHPSMPT